MNVIFIGFVIQTIISSPIAGGADISFLEWVLIRDTLIVPFCQIVV